MSVRHPQRTYISMYCVSVYAGGGYQSVLNILFLFVDTLTSFIESDAIWMAEVAERMKVKDEAKMAFKAKPEALKSECSISNMLLSGTCKDWENLCFRTK